MTKNEDSQNNHDSQSNVLSTLLEGGLPQILAGPAGKAVSRLIGAGVDIPATYLEGLAQRHRDKTEGRSLVSKAIAEKAATMAVDDPAIMQRGLNTMLDKAYRSQINKEAVATIAVEELVKSPPPESSAGPSDDWMNKFERHAEDASSEELREMFGRLLAEEVRQPGNISSTSLRFVSELDSDVAKIIQRVLPYSIREGATLLELLDPELTLQERMLLEQAGFWSSGENLMFAITSNSNSKARLILRKDLTAEFEFKAEESLFFSCAFLSKLGVDLLSVTETQFDFAALVKLVKMKPGAGTIQKGTQSSK